MKKETTIKVSKEFKQFLFDKKKEGEDFEALLKRMVYQYTKPSIPVNQYTKEIKKPKTDFIEIPDEETGIPTMVEKSIAHHWIKKNN